VTRQRSSSTFWGRLTIGALGAAVVGILLQISAGVDFPTIPPGLVILLVAAGFVAVAPWRWAPLVGAAVGLSQFAGLFLADQGGRLVDSSPLGGFAGIWIQLVAVALAMIAGVVAGIRSYRGRSQTR